MKTEEKKVAARSGGLMPFRFFQGRGEETEVLILDESMDDAFWRHEHNLKIGGKWGNHEPCIAESGPCPFCEEGSKPALVVLLTVLVLKPYKNKKTGKTVQYSKMLLPLKRGQYADFDKLEEIAIRKHGTLRGTVVMLFRKDEDNSFSTGMPTPNDDGNLISDWYSEEDLAAEYGHDPIVKDGKTIKKADEDIEPFNYKKLFPEPNAEEIRAEHGMSVPGSRRANREAVDDDEAPARSTRRRRDQEEDADDIPDVPSRSSRRQRAAAPVEDEDDVEEDDVEEEAPKSRRGRPTPSPSEDRSRSRTRGAARDTDADEEVEDEEEVEEEVVPARRRRSAEPPAPTPRSRRAAPPVEDDEEEVEDEPEEEEEPPRRRSARAASAPPASATKRTGYAASSVGGRKAPKFED
jgi:hypothetical protein